MDRKPRLLEDIWVQLSGLTPHLIDIFATIPQLKKMKYPRRIEITSHLQSKFQEFYRDFTSFINSSPVMEVLRPLSPLSITAPNHLDCCPPPPFVPHFFQYPPAGIFHLIIQCLQTWIRSCLYPSLTAELKFEEEAISLEDQDATSYSLELCKTFAGIEYQFDHNTAVIFPCFVSIILGAVNGPSNLRPWILSKLRHFEEQGQICNASIKKTLSVLWNMPELATEGLGVIVPNNSSGKGDVGEVVAVTAGWGKVNLNLEEGNIEDVGLEALVQLRGIFGLQDG